MPSINIRDTVINFPDSGTSPNWAPAVIAFAQAVEDALNLLVGSADVSPQNYTIDAFNPVTSQNIPNLLFSTSIVRAAFIRYSVYRTTSLSTVTETGTIIVVYNASNPVSNKWEIIQYKTGDASISFAITDTGQMQFTTTTLAGTGHAGKIAFAAQALLQS